MLRALLASLATFSAVFASVLPAAAGDPSLPERHARQLELELDRITALAERAAADAELEPRFAEERLRFRRHLHHFRGRLAARDGVGRLRQDLDALERRAALLGADARVEPAKGGAGGRLSGRVTAAATGAPLAGISVAIVDAGLGLLVDYLVTDANGRFASDLPAGTYRVATWSGLAWLDEIWDDVPCPGSIFNGCQPDDGTPIEVRAEAATAGIDFALERGGAVAGTVTAAADGEPIPFVDISVWNAAGNTVSWSQTDEDGAYLAGGLAAGDHLVLTRNYFDFRDELYDDHPCAGFGLGGCEPADGDPVPVAANEVTAGVDFALDALGTISGTVTDLAGAPLLDVGVEVWDDGGGIVATGVTDAAGRYRTGGVADGAYYVKTINFAGYVDEVYDDRPCPGRTCDFTVADPVTVALAATTAGVDFALAPGGSISGTVTVAPTGEPIRFQFVEVWNVAGQLTRSDRTDDSGHYVVGGLPAGRFFVLTVTSFGYVDEVYDDVPCFDRSCPTALGTPIDLAPAAAIGGVDFALDRRGSIAGRVTSAVTGAPIVPIEVYVLDEAFTPVTRGNTNLDGRYFVGDLFPGAYFVATRSPGYLDEVYPGVPCRFGETCAGGTMLAVEVNTELTGIDFALETASGIQGTVTDELTGEPLAGVAIDVVEEGEFGVIRTATDDAGRYSVGLGPGAYFVSTDHGEAVDEIWDDVPCPGGPGGEPRCDLAAGTPVIVTESAVRDGVDFALFGVPCADNGRDLCLKRNRFRVSVTWRGPDGATGPGRPARLTGDAGTFWFFQRDNVELVVKLLDGCFEPFDSFWFFAAGLTDVEVEITVTDRLTGAAKTYRNPGGTAFQPVLDTRAFSGCPLLPLASETVAAAPLVPPPAADDAKGVPCLPGPHRLCLSRDRFRVEAFWRTPDGRAGRGTPVQLTRDTGYFWFFSPANVEVIVKALDACRLEPFHNYWVFAAGLTNVEVTLRVTDAVTGDVREYSNPQGRSFQPILDTNAFATCPEL